jgi:hypothetical protein
MSKTKTIDSLAGGNNRRQRHVLVFYNDITSQQVGKTVYLRKQGKIPIA